jgi:hypothetical protein
VRLDFSIPYAAQSELDLYEVNRLYASQLLESTTRKRESGERVDGKELELLASYLLSCVPGFDVRSNVRTEGPQYDAIIRNRGPKSDYRADLGFYLLVECKDWNKPVSVGDVSQFIHKLVMQDCRGGILFSSSGITGEDENRYAKLEVLKAHYRAGRIVMVLNQDDFRLAATGDNLVSLLRDKYEQIRFDIVGSDHG